MDVFPQSIHLFSPTPVLPIFFLFLYPKAKSSTLNVPIHPLYLQIFQNLKTLLKFLCNFSSDLTPEMGL